MIINATPDREKAKSIISLIADRINFVQSADSSKFSTIIAENYYEIIKELASAVILLDGFKAVGENAHKDLIEHLSKCGEMEGYEISVIDDLRIKRNKSCYEGKKIEFSYIENKKNSLMKIIEKLRVMLDKRLERMP